MSVFIDGADFAGLADFYSVKFPAAILLAQVNAVNKAARYGLQLATDEMLKEVRFPTGYLDQPQRFFISQFAQSNLVEARVTARDRATSLLRFAVGNPTPSSTRGGKNGVAKGQGGVDVEVNPGEIKRITSAFVISLRNGNYGIAVKVTPGITAALKSKKFFSGAQLGHDYYILYGPSVDQVFRTVSQDVAEKVGLELADQFAVELNAQDGK